jgi:hypothetical protein
MGAGAAPLIEKPIDATTFADRIEEFAGFRK